MIKPVPNGGEVANAFDLCILIFLQIMYCVSKK